MTTTVKSHWNPFNANFTPSVAKTDYAINAGAPAETDNFGGPSSLAQGKDASWWATHTNEKVNQSKVEERHKGISYQRSMVTMADIRDGSSNTYLVGEKHLQPNAYQGWTSAVNDTGDNEVAYSGYNRDFHRSVAHQPFQDRNDFPNTYNFGSAHSGAFNMSLCDGSVRSISYSISAEIHRRLGVRNDGQPIDSSAF